MTPNEILTKFLKNRNLQKPAGKAIYSYRITKEEYENLKYALIRLKRPESYPAAFFLYASEWCRREYSEGHRRFEDIFGSLNANEPSNPLRTKLVKNGAGYWKVPILKSTTGEYRYLSTIILNGGLPISALNKGTGQAIIRQMIVSTCLMLIDNPELEPIEAVNEKAEGLQGALFKQNDYRELLASFIVSILAIRKEMRQSGFRLNEIDYHIRKWQLEFPIYIESSEELQFLKDLLENLEQEEKKSEINTIQLKCFLESLSNDHSDSYILKGQILVDKGRNNLDYFLPDANTSLQDFPGTFSLEFSDNESNIIKTKKVSKISDKAEQKVNILTGETFHFSEENLKNGIYVGFADSSGSFRTENKFECFEPIEPKQSLIFIKKDEKWILHARASCRVPNRAYRILLPKDYSLELNPPIKRIGDVDDWHIYEITGDFTYSLDGQKYSIKVGDGNILSDDYHLKLQFNSLISNFNSNVSIGLPLIFKRENNIRSRVIPNRIRINGQEITLENREKLLFGRKKLQVLDDENCIVYQRTLTFLPDTFSAEIQGNSISIQNLEGFEISQISDKKRRKFDSMESIIPEITEPPKRCLDFALTLNGKEARFKIPAPITQFHFFGADLKQVRNGSIIGIDLISSIRISGRSNLRGITIEFRLLKPDATLIEHITIDPNRISELSLSRFRGKIESMLALGNIDGKVRITIIGGGNIEINRFGNINDYALLKRPTFQLTKSPLKIKIFDLKIPELNQELREYTLEETTGEIEISTGMIGTDKAIILPSRPGRYESLAFRPILFIPQTGSEDENESQGDRIKRLKAEYDQASTDFSETSKFNQLPGLFRNMGYIPMQCFDDWAAIAGSKKAIVRLHLEAALNSAEFGNILEELKKQFLLEYSWVPLNKWIEVIDEFFNQFSATPDNQILGNISQTLKQRLLDKVRESADLCRLDLVLKKHFYPNMSLEEILAEFAPNQLVLPECIDALFSWNGNWPGKPEIQEAVAADFERLPDDLKNEFLVQKNGLSRNILDKHKSVFLMPAVLGYLSVENLNNSSLLSLLYKPDFRLRLAEIIEFNPNYYQTAFQFARNFTYIQKL